ncbi:hypothetical protein PUR71_25145 [Streptomyces sp. SP17BM10]|uniref:hypothetical protein n=1 Tax=Streptomyces sp. SP17BM10 TaxID=3002530 RepID=UPI002E776530|nr:hypothetical protein [Streptomyces sp. SP17BM10]MEE1786160.1 hypothetical protein [Streptomyces sp. SP17BM10]
MRVPRPGAVRLAVGAARVALVAEILLSLWIAYSAWSMRGVDYLDDDGTDFARYGTALFPVLGLLWAGLCAWGVVASVLRSRSGERGAVSGLTVVAVAHFLGGVFSAFCGGWHLGGGLFLLCILYTTAANPARPHREPGLSGG